VLARLQREVSGLAPATQPSSRAEGYTVSTWLDRWYVRTFKARGGRFGTGVSRSHDRRTRWAIEQLKDGLGSHSLFSLTTEHVEDWLAHRATVKIDRAVWGRNACRNVKNVLGDALDTARTRGYAPALNVAREAHLPHEAAAPEQRHSLDEHASDKLYRAARDNGKNEALIVALQLVTGLRPGEARALRWRDVDLQAGTLRVAKAKTATGLRTITLCDAALGVLKQRALAAELNSRNPAAFVFPGLRGMLAETTLCDVLAELCEQLSLYVDGRVLHPHELRHTCGSLLIDKGMRVDKVAQMLGAKVETILRVYHHQLDKLVGASAHDALDSIFGRGAA
jgi:integrase